jgi:integrase
MSRIAKPWFRKQTGWWMVTVGGRQHKLAEGRENKKLAQKKFCELQLLVAEAPESADVRVASICDAFLQWSERHQAAETYRGNSFYVQSFCEACGYLPVADLRPHHVTKWTDSKAWGPTSQFNAVRAAQRVFNWAVEQKLLLQNPIKGMKRPRQESRDSYASEEEIRALLRGAAPAFRLFLFALRQTGARPSEVRELTWDWVYDDHWALSKHKTVGKTGQPRVIRLTRKMRRLMGFLRRKSKSKYVFVNCHGNKWTSNAVRLQMQRLRKRLGLRDNLCAYEIRHAFGTFGIVNGVDIATLAELMGHRDTTMISRVYGHLANQNDHLAAAVAKAAGTSGGAGRNPKKVDAGKRPAEGRHRP